MSRIDERFTQLRGQGRTGVVTYVTAGDPNLQQSAEIIKRLDRAGAQRPRVRLRERARRVAKQRS